MECRLHLRRSGHPRDTGEVVTCLCELELPGPCKQQNDEYVAGWTKSTEVLPGKDASFQGGEVGL